MACSRRHSPLGPARKPPRQGGFTNALDRLAFGPMRLRRLSLVSIALVAACSSNSDGPDLEAQVHNLVSQMTLEEKVAQMAGDSGLLLPEGETLWNVPGVERLGVPPLRMADGPRGVGTIEGATTFPVGMARGAMWEPEVEQRIGAAMGRELRAIGGNVLLAPTINILRHPSWGRSQDTYGEDAQHLTKMGVAFVRGVQEYVLANPKHYAANSIEDTRFEVDVSIDQRTLREIFLPHFRAAVLEGGAASVMSAYNSVNGQFCGENEQLLRKILKTEWRFDGFVLSDWTFGTHSTLGSALNGLDIEMSIARVYGDELLRAVRNGDVPESVVDEAVSRTVRKKLQYGLDKPTDLDGSVLANDEHLDLAKEAAVKGAVLLKNESMALPLVPSALTRVVVVGLLADTPNTGDNGSSGTKPSFVVTPLQGIQEALGDSVVIDHIDKNVLDAADLATIGAADAVIIVTGLTSEDEGEGLIGAGDRVDLGLGARRTKLIQDAAGANDRAIVVLEGGGAITVGDWLSDADALLMVWYPGQMGGHAIADLLFGVANPSGKLPLTFPTGLDQLPPFDNTSLDVTYDYFHGYRYLDRNDEAPEFEFGFGLSYTTFAVENLRADRTEAATGDTVTFTVDVANTGSVAGAEVVQLYVGYPDSSVERAERELKGFAKVSLEPGETKAVDISVPVDSLAYYDIAASAWTLEALEHVVHIGTSSRDLPLSTTLRVAGGMAR